MATRTVSVAGGNWNNVASWVELAVPTAADDVVGAATSGNLTINVGAACRSIHMADYPSGSTLTHNTGIDLAIGDGTPGTSNIALDFTGAWTYTRNSATSSTITFISTSATVQDVIGGGKTFSNQAYTGSGSWILSGNLTLNASGILSHTAGTFDTGGNNITAGAFSGTSATTRVLTLGASTITLSSTGFAVWNLATTIGLTFSAASSTIIFTGTNPNFSGGGKTYGKVEFTGATGVIVISGSNTFGELKSITTGRTFRLTAGTTQTITLWSLSGTAGNLLVIESTVAGTAATVSKSSGRVCVDYLSLKDSTAAGGATWYAGANSTNTSGNTGWVFTACPAITPAAVAAVATVGVPTVKTGSTVSPATVSAVASIGVPSVTTGSSDATAAPATVAATVTIAAPSISTGSTVSPATVTATASVGAPSISTDATVAPATVEATASIGAPSISTGTTVSPSTVAATVTIGAPTVQVDGSVIVSPATVHAVVTIGVPTVSVPSVEPEPGGDTSGGGRDVLVGSGRRSGRGRLTRRYLGSGVLARSHVTDDSPQRRW